MGGPHGVLLIDKPRGPTSHDVVGRVRRALKTRAVGHAGTLDPMASGLLVVLVGEATKLSNHLTGDDKRYLTTVALGVATNTLDAEGGVTEEAPVPDDLLAELALGEAGPRLAAALTAERARTAQVPPSISAIHVDGERAYERARRGEELSLPPREVAVRELRLVGVDTSGKHPALTVEVKATKGYYVRSLGRDLGAALGLPAHLTALRRLSSGAFEVGEAASLDEPEALAGRLVSLEEAAARAMPCVELTELGEKRCRWGQKLSGEDFAAGVVPEGTSAWLRAGRLVALGEGEAGSGRVLRGFAVLAGGGRRSAPQPSGASWR